MTLKDIYCADDVALIKEGLSCLMDNCEQLMDEFDSNTVEYQEASAKRYAAGLLLGDCK